MSSMKSTLAKTKSMMEKLDTILTDAEKTKSQLTDFTQSWKLTESDIKSASQNLRAVIDLQEKKLLVELESVADKDMGELKADINAREMRIQMYQQQSEVIHHAVDSDCEMDMYKMWHFCESRLKNSEYDKDIDLNKGTPDRIGLRKNTDQLIKVINDLHLGEIEVTYESGVDLIGTPVLEDSIFVNVAGDQDVRGYPNDVIVLDVNGTRTVVVTDWHNNFVKSFYSRKSQSCHSKIRPYNRPWCLTQLTCNQVAVTLPDNRQIIKVEVNPDLKLLSTITLQKKYNGITALTPSTVAVSSYWPPSVDILDMTGTVIRSLTPSLSNKSILQKPSFLCTTKTGNILVSDWGTNSVLCLTAQGDVVFNYSPTGDTALQSPRGMTITCTGDILVADFVPCSVIHLTGTGLFVRNILTSQNGLSYLAGLSYDNRGRLYVCLCYECIKVFKM